MTTIIAKNKNYFVYSLTCSIGFIYRPNMKLFSYLKGKKKAPSQQFSVVLNAWFIYFFK